MSQKCNYCINKGQCEKCDQVWKDLFIPADEVKQYFYRGYSGIKGIDGYQYTFDNTNKKLVSTHSVRIEGHYYCPYCGEKMFSIQDGDTLAVLGYCCICQGARDEIEYEKKMKELKKKHEEEISKLDREYSNKLKFCEEKLLEIKHEKEMHSLKFNITTYRHSHLSTRNGEKITKIEQML